MRRSDRRAGAAARPGRRRCNRRPGGRGRLALRCGLGSASGVRGRRGRSEACRERGLDCEPAAPPLRRGRSCPPARAPERPPTPVRVLSVRGSRRIAQAMAHSFGRDLCERGRYSMLSRSPVPRTVSSCSRYIPRSVPSSPSTRSGWSRKCWLTRSGSGPPRSAGTALRPGDLLRLDARRPTAEHEKVADDARAGRRLERCPRGTAPHRRGRRVRPSRGGPPDCGRRACSER